MGVGTDSVSCVRIARFGPERLAGRILTPEERETIPAGGQRLIEWMAGRFAAKEAISKAAGSGIGATVGFRDITIHPDERGKPIAHVSDAARRRLGWLGDVQIHLSITHTEDHALAFAVMEQRG
ncbi:holo-ACP synthase [Desmospora profundinema]|nr:holo-ACP synthase [Desmospora profundinema]